LKEKKSLQFYDEKNDMFLPDRYVEGTCPNCGFEEARSDECENCGTLYDPKELKNPKSKISGEEPVLKETSHQYFPLGKYQPRLEEYVNEMNEKYGWKDNVIHYIIGWFKEGLKDRAVTRDLDWGVKVPIKNVEGKVLYVWFEAVLGYISSTKEYAEKIKQPDLWKDYWLDPKTKYIAFIGKDNIVFHCIFFPAMLMAWNDGDNDKYCLPQNVPANEFLNFEGKKFSKSRNWGIDGIDFLNQFPADPLRYALASNLPENRDTDFHWKEFQARNNNELADILGNFINRTFTFVHKHFDGLVPEQSNLNKADKDMLKLISAYPEKIAEYFERYKFKDGTNEIMNLAREGNKYFNDSEPWITIKTDKNRCGTTLNICIQAIYTLAELFEPVIPFSSEKVFKMLNSNPTSWKKSGDKNLPAGHKLNKAGILFPKIEDKIIDDQIAKLGSDSSQETEEELISYDDFMKTQLQVAEVLEAENIKKSKKLLKLKVKLGNGERQVIAGIAESYKAEDVVGKKVIVVENLKPAKLMGQESRGMILAVENADGKLEVITVDKNVKNGTRVT
jgi:methionyl-tRNA synthetase